MKKLLSLIILFFLMCSIVQAEFNNNDLIGKNYSEKQIELLKYLTRNASTLDASGRSSFNSVFGEKITGVRKPSISAQFQYGLLDDDADITENNGGTVAVVDNMLTFSTGTNIAGQAIAQSKNYVRYLPGSELYCNFTCAFTTPKADSYQYAGIFDDNDGFFIGYDGTDFIICRRRAGVDFKTIIPQSAFADIFDEGYTFDPTKLNVYKISFGYLGAATINFEIMQASNEWKVLYKIEYPGTATVTHIAQTYLPVRGEVANTGNNTDIVIKVGSLSAGIVDGAGAVPSERVYNYSKGITSITTNPQLIFTFRNKTTYNSIENRISALLCLVSLSTELNKNARFQFLLNPTLTNTPTWSDMATNSILEISTDATINTATGEILLPVNVFKTDTFFEYIRELGIKIRPGDIVAILLRTDAGVTGTTDISIRWREEF